MRDEDSVADELSSITTEEATTESKTGVGDSRTLLLTLTTLLLVAPGDCIGIVSPGSASFLKAETQKQPFQFLF